jgi:HD-like signal output (HDOD) protein
MVNVDDIVDDVAAMVSLPAVAVRICELADDPKSTALDLERIIAPDLALTARLLKIANSPAIGMQRKITTISRAITLLGTRTVRDLALGVAAVNSFDRIPVELITMEDFWTHSMLAAASARELASHTARRAAAESAFVEGLLHDVGMLILFRSRPDESRQALLMHADDPGERTVQQCEREIFGFTHCDVGAALARRWHLPPALQACIEFHDDPSIAPDHLFDVAIVHIADRIAMLAEIDSVNLENTEPISDIVWTLTGLSPECVPGVVAAARLQLTDIRTMLG